MFEIVENSLTERNLTNGNFYVNKAYTLPILPSKAHLKNNVHFYFTINYFVAKRVTFFL